MNLKSLLLLLTFVTGSAHSIEIENISLPDMGDSSGSLISPRQEQALGAAFFRNLHTRANINQDIEIQQYIQNIGFQLASHSDTPGYPFHFFVVNDSVINAFAGPGGYVGINSGLILLTESESELASVMAHEIAHVTQRHLYRAFEAASKLSLPMAAATLAAILVGTQSPAMGQAAIMAVQAGATQFQINFTRDNEKEADRVGMKILAQADYNPRSMPIFFESLQHSSRFYGQNIPEFLRTHPVSASRIADTRGRAERYPYKQYPDSKEYALSKAKLRVLTSQNLETTLRYFSSHTNIGTDWQKAVAAYGMGLTYLATQQYKQAQILLSRLVKQYPNQPQFILAFAQTETETGKVQHAYQLYRKAIQKFPDNIAIKLAYIKSLLKTNRPKQARRVLESLAEPLQNQAVYYELLAQSYADSGLEAESHRFLAEYYYALGNTHQAILQIKLAKQSKNLNFYLKAILDERLNHFRQEEQQRKQLL